MNRNRGIAAIHRAGAAFGIVAVAGLLACAPAWCAGESGSAEASAEAASDRGGVSLAIRTAGLAIAAALAIGLTGLATARVQAAVGAGGTGAMAEKPELFTNILVLFAIPETIVVLGFVVAYLLLSSI